MPFIPVDIKQVADSGLQVGIASSFPALTFVLQNEAHLSTQILALEPCSTEQSQIHKEIPTGSTIMAALQDNLKTQLNDLSDSSGGALPLDDAIRTGICHLQCRIAHYADNLISPTNKEYCEVSP